MFHPETADIDRFEQVIVQSLRQILTTPEPADFLAWARSHLPELIGLSMTSMDEVESHRLANVLGTALWNAAPHPTNGFHTAPIDPPPLDSPCYCGSGLPYRDCCADLADMPELSTELLWEFLVDELSGADLRAALDSGAVPEPILARIANRWLEENHPGRAVTLLEPLFAGAIEDLDERYEPALDILCDAYDQLDHWKKKRNLLRRMCEEGSPALQGVAWQRRSLQHIDEGDFARAQDAFHAAQRQSPDEPGTAMLEITLLAAQNRIYLARERARFWLYRFRRQGYTEGGFLEFLARAMEDPQEALLDQQADTLDPALIDLHDWTEVIAQRPLPRYGLQTLKEPASPRPSGQLSLFEAGARDLSPAPGINTGLAPLPVLITTRAARLHPSAGVRRTEAPWRALFPETKPDSIHLTLPGDSAVWEEEHWLDFLLGHPEVADSLEILDDLANALYCHPESALPWVSNTLLRPLLERNRAVLEQTLPRNCGWHIPWSDPHNRPALRMLFRLYLCQVSEESPEEASHTLETLLRLNPQDNHGIRAELMNQYLRDGKDEQALALAERFPNDLLADLAYGQVLALYRLGRQDRARLALGTAMNRLPRIPHYLTRKRIKQPNLTPLGITPGGDAQAWLYREAMRDVWAAEPGILAWLKRLTA